MSFFIIDYIYDPAKDADAVRPVHRAYLRELYAAGSLKAAGPLLGTDPVGRCSSSRRPTRPPRRR